MANDTHAPASSVDQDDADKTKKLTGSREGGDDMTANEDGAGEDEGSTENEGEDAHLNDDQKSTPM